MPDAALLRTGSHGLLELTGRDRVRFLHNLCTNDLFKLASGRDGGSYGKRERPDFSRTPAGPGCFATTVTRQGKMVAAYTVWMLEDRLLLDVDLDSLPALADLLRKSAIMDDVVISDRSAESVRFVAVGAGARQALDLPASIPPFHVLQAGRRLLSPFPWRSCAVVLRCPPEEASAVAALLPAAGDASVESLRIEEGRPRWGVDMGPEDLPMEAGLEALAISYSKGCYLGQEVIQRVKTYSEPPRRLVTLAIEGDIAPAPGSPVSAGGTVVGRITSSTAIPRPMAIAWVAKGHLAKGTRLDAAGLGATVR